MRQERGFALLVVLWAVVLLALLVTQVTAAGRGEARLAFNLRQAAVLEAAADGALAEGIFHALDSSSAHWPANGTVHALSLRGTTAEVRIDSEAGKVDLNSAPQELLAALLHVAGADTQTATRLSAAIADWRFVDTQRTGGAKTPAYQAAGLGYGPPSAPFQSLQELGLVLGMTPGLLARLTPHLTIYHQGEPDSRAADPVVLRALREASFAAPPPTQGAPDENTVAITATALGPAGTRFIRRAVVRLGQGSKGTLFNVLTWDREAAQ